MEPIISEWLRNIGSTVDNDLDSAEELQELADVLGRYAAYVEAMANARKHRLAGDIEAAQAFERNAGATYKRLPEDAKW